MRTTMQNPPPAAQALAKIGIRLTKRGKRFDATDHKHPESPTCFATLREVLVSLGDAAPVWVIAGVLRQENGWSDAEQWIIDILAEQPGLIEMYRLPVGRGRPRHTKRRGRGRW